jgi:hypothetical protein
MAAEQVLTSVRYAAPVRGPYVTLYAQMKSRRVECVSEHQSTSDRRCHRIHLA